jgi:hypothetical protein
MTYASDSVYGHGYSKWDTIQEDVADMYLDDVEDTIEDEEDDIFGFSKSIEIDHLTDEEVDTVLAMFGDDN